MNGIYNEIFEDGVTDGNIAIACDYAKLKTMRKIELIAVRANIALELNYNIHRMSKRYDQMNKQMSELGLQANKLASEFANFGCLISVMPDFKPLIAH